MVGLQENHVCCITLVKAYDFVVSTDKVDDYLQSFV